MYGQGSKVYGQGRVVRYMREENGEQCVGRMGRSVVGWCSMWKGEVV